MTECSGADRPCHPAGKTAKCEGLECGKPVFIDDLTARPFGRYKLPNGSWEPIVLWLCPECDIKYRTKGQSTRDPKKVGRNDPCPCGSGKKFKKCCS